MAVQLTPSPFTPQPVGTPITWTATAGKTGPGVIDYQFSVRKGTDKFRIVQDYQTSNQIVQAVTTHEGGYTFRVIARNRNSGQTAASQVSFEVTSRLNGEDPVITKTTNPLVALYSAPGCASGRSMYIRFEGGGEAHSTSVVPCTSESSMNFYIGGMLAGTT